MREVHELVIAQAEKTIGNQRWQIEGARVVCLFAATTLVSVYSALATSGHKSFGDLSLPMRLSTALAVLLAFAILAPWGARGPSNEEWMPSGGLSAANIGQAREMLAIASVAATMVNVPYLRLAQGLLAAQLLASAISGISLFALYAT